MNRTSTLSRLQDVFREVFEDDDLTLTPSTSAADLEEWDSLMHVTLILAVEGAFGVRFTSAQVSSLETVGDLVSLIEARG
ncbi:MAG: acyl carrier protein [Deltaproteobacteria bacterium]|nr:acyl carrier protein [Deltaproteobacteria bacterium]